MAEVGAGEAMLTAAERREIQTELVHVERKQAAFLDALKIVQRHRGFVSDEALAALAAFLEIAPERLESLATFYNLIFRLPVGRHVILLCDSIACWILGQERLQEHLTTTLGIAMGETTRDGRFTLLPVPCLGACDRAPAMIIDGELYTELTEARIDEVLRAHE